MKKLVKKVLKPEKSFEEWALENNIELPERRLQPRRRCILKWITATAMALVLCLSITLPIIYGKNSGNNGSEPVDPDPGQKHYLENDSDTIDIIVKDKKELVEFFKSKNILFFNSDRISDEQNIPKIYSDIAKDDKTLVLSHFSKEYFIRFNDDEQQFFLLDYRVVVYENYTFIGQTDYNGLIDHFIEDGKTVYYKIANFIEDSIAYIRFSHNGYNYYLKVREIPELKGSELSEDNLNKFFKSLFV